MSLVLKGLENLHFPTRGKNFSHQWENNFPRVGKLKTSRDIFFSLCPSSLNHDLEFRSRSLNHDLFPAYDVNATLQL